MSASVNAVKYCNKEFKILGLINKNKTDKILNMEAVRILMEDAFDKGRESK